LILEKVRIIINLINYNSYKLNTIVSKENTVKTIIEWKQAIISYLQSLSVKQKLLRISIISILPFFCILLLYLATGLGVFGKLPTQDAIRNISNPIASELYTSNEKLIGRYYIENRTHLKKEDINELYKNALIATEDHRFYKHNGVDYRSLMRVFFKSILLQRDASGGGSTITQQLAKNLYPRKRYKFLSTVINKFREMHTAKRVEKTYSKEEIIWMYSNTVSFGERAFGLATASSRFFNKVPKDLLLEEAAVLVGVLKATTYFSPRKHPERAEKRRNVVLSQMKKHGYIDQSSLDELRKSPIKLDYQPEDEVLGLAQYFQQHVKKEFDSLSKTFRKKDGTKYNIFNDGLKIYTSLDYDLQVSAEKIVLNHMKSLQKIFETSWKGGKLFGKANRLIDENILAHPVYKLNRKKGQSSKEAIKNFNVEKEEDLWTWNGNISKKITRIDSIKHYLKLLHTGLLAVDPQTGKIKVWIGGNDFKKFQYDNVTEGRQVGSLFKPIVYLTALEQKKEACDFYKNELRTYSDYDDWTPKNSGDEYGGYLSMNTALAHSVNTVSVQVLFDAGIDNVVKTAEDLGIKNKLAKVPSIVLGTSDVSLYEMVQAYANITNNNSIVELSGIERIENRDGEVIYESELIKPLENPKFDTSSIASLKSMMTKVTREGTASRLYSLFDIPFPVFGKTGTTQKQSDGWFIGCTDNLVIGSWVGTKDRRVHFRNIGTGSGGRTALPMVGALFEYASQKGHIKYPFSKTKTFTCPDYLDDNQYAYYQKNQGIFEEKVETIEDEPIYGGWLGKLLKRKKRKKKNGNRGQKSEELKIKQELEKLKLERDERMRQYEDEMKAWEKRLQELKENG